MDQGTNKILFALLRSAICKVNLAEDERKICSPEVLGKVLKWAQKHDVAHLVVLGLKENQLIPEEHTDIEKFILKAVYRHERTECAYTELCKAFENAQIPFLPLKGAVMRRYYPEPWMRTSCDIDVLVHREDLDKAISFLENNNKYTVKSYDTHDVSLYSPSGIHVELHFDLIEEGQAKNAGNVLLSVWDNAAPEENSRYRYEMSDAYFYFYHIAHMAKHFQTGGCGIRPFIDLWMLDNLNAADKDARDALLLKGGLLVFANSSRTLGKVWFENEKADDLSLRMQEFLLHGGVYGSSDNRVALLQKKKGGRIGYIFSRVFAPYARLKRYYPVLEKHPWLTPIMQVRRWFKLLDPSVANMAKQEISANSNIEKSKLDEMNNFLKQIGLN